MLLCLMVLGLPLQGYAALSQSLCHQGEAQTSEPQSAHAHHHDQGHAAVEASAPVSPDQDLAGLDHTCSNCATCCFGASLVGLATANPVMAPWPSVQVAAIPLLQGNATLDSIERPPPTRFN